MDNLTPLKNLYISYIFLMYERSSYLKYEQILKMKIFKNIIKIR